MKIILKTNNPVTLSYAKSVLDQAGIGNFTMDVNASIMEGSIGAIPRRLMVIDEEFESARNVLVEAGLKEELWRG